MNDSYLPTAFTTQEQPWRYSHEYETQRKEGAKLLRPKNAERTHERKAHPKKNDCGDSCFWELVERATPLKFLGMHVSVGHEA